MTDWQNRIVGYTTKPANQLAAHPYNARRHPAKQRDALRGSLDSLGIISPVLENVRTGFIIDGHARVEEMLTRDENMEVPVIQLDLDESEEALALASFDFITYMAQYDADNLDALLQQVNTDNTAMQSLLSELAEDNGLYFGDEPQVQDAPDAQIDRAEELLQKWGVVAGDIWEIPSQHGGVHRLMCGDSTSAEDVALLMGEGEQPSLMVTDPPYGISYDATWREDAGINSMGKTAGHDIGWDDVADWREAYSLSPAVVAYVWHATSFSRVVADGLEDAGFEVKQQIIWNKTVAAFGRSHYSYKHEPCWYAVRTGSTSKWCGPANEVTVWDMAEPLHIMGGSNEEKQPHATQKPLEAMARPIRNHEGNVYDPFLGSGTTMVAAETLQRVCFGMELEPKYCAVILQRMQDMSLVPRKVN